MNRLAALIAAVLSVLLGGPPASAHDFGAMLISVTVRDGQYSGQIRVDPQHLPPALSAALNSADQATREGARSELGESLARLGQVSFQGVAEPPELSLVASAAPEQDDTLRWSFSGIAPAGTYAIVWRCDAKLGRYLLRIRHDQPGEELVQWLDPGQASDPVAITGPLAQTTTARVIADHLRLGFTHIIPFGLDHILFVLGLFLLTARVSPVLIQATAFTVAHSITLAMAVCGVVSPPPAIVEPLIAASIVVVGIENIFVRRCTSRRTVVAFVFGLLHGLGFAGVLKETGMPAGHLIPALISFNVGVELGQAAVILAAFLLVGVWFSRRSWYHARIAAPASVAIAAVAAFWTVERLGW